MDNISGSYEVVANTPMGDQTMTISLEVDGDSFKGNSTGSMGASDIAGTVDGHILTWKQAISVPMALTLDCKATIEDGKFNGTVDTGAFGAFPIKGVKIG